jgi:hypothetical protein
MFIIVFICVSNEWKTVFHTHYGHFEYLIMSFELANASATFQAYINWALAEHMNFICVVYLTSSYTHNWKKNTNIMYVKYLSIATLQAVCQLEKMCFLYWHCRVSEIYSVNHWDDNEFTTNWHY